MKRSIIIFPKFNNIELIQNIRKEYDPLYNSISPHITVVFPFINDISDEELQSIVTNSLSSIEPFKLVMNGITANGDYLFLNVKNGNDEIIKIKDLLYSNLSFEYNNHYTYIPHITVGVTSDIDNALLKLSDFNNEFETIIDTISIEMIDEDEKSNIIYEINLLKV